MSVALRITFDEYTRMIADGAFDALRDRRIELIRGELREVTPPGPDHSGAVDWLNEWSVLAPPRGAVTDYDCADKADLYAAPGIADYWVFDLPQRAVHVFRQPSPQGYRERFTVRFGEELHPLAFPQVTLALEELLSLA